MVHLILEVMRGTGRHEKGFLTCDEMGQDPAGCCRIVLWSALFKSHTRTGLLLRLPQRRRRGWEQRSIFPYKRRAWRTPIVHPLLGITLRSPISTRPTVGGDPRSTVAPAVENDGLAVL